jgi:ATP-binding cassette, subfamily B, bacterial PglK
MINIIKETFFILNSGPRNIFSMSALFFIGAIIEVLSIMLLVKYLALLVDFSDDHLIVQLVRNYFLYIEQKDIIFYIGILLILIFALKAVITFLIQKSILKYSFNSTSSLINRLFDSYVINGKSDSLVLSVAIQNITSHVFTFINQGLISILKIFSELFFLVFISTVLLSQSFYLASLVVGGLISFFILFNYFIAPLIRKYSLGVNDSQQNIIATVQDTMLGLDEVTVYNLSKDYQDKLQSFTRKYKDGMLKFNVLDTLPRIGYEFIIVFFIIFYILSTLSSSDNTLNILEPIVMFAIVAIRLIPTISQISTHINNIKFSSIARSHLISEVRKKQNKSSNIINTEILDGFKTKINSIELKNLTFSYTDNLSVLSGINATFLLGEIIGVKGPSGSGKSTLAKIILGLIEPKSGLMQLNGDNIANSNELRNNVSYVPQYPYIFNSTIKDNICLNLPVDENKLTNIIKISNLNFVEDRLDDKINNEVSTLSGGQIQRIGIARALYSSRDVMIFDEPSSALDKKAEEMIKESLLKIKKNKIIIVISHSDNLLSICDKEIEL